MKRHYTNLVKLIILTVLFVNNAIAVPCINQVDKIQCPNIKDSTKHCVLIHHHYVYYNYHYISSKKPTFVLESGFKCDSRAWRKLRPLLNTIGNTLVYDRPGLGRSSAIKPPNLLLGRTAYNVADNLHKLLSKLHITSFILIGHSLGGDYALVYTAKYPKTLKGLILLDPGLPELLKWKQFNPYISKISKASPLYYEALGLTPSLKQMRYALVKYKNRLLRIPKLLIVATDHGSHHFTKNMEYQWISYQNKFARNFSAKEIILDSNHDLQITHAKTVFELIKLFLKDKHIIPSNDSKKMNAE